jgi:hypothetical protein
MSRRAIGTALLNVGTMHRVSRARWPLFFCATTDGVVVDDHGELLTPDAASEHILRDLL